MATGAAQEMLGNIPCGICNTYKDVIWRCQSCPETLCNQCKIYHLKSRASRNHKVTKLANVTEENQSSSIFCPNHQSEAFQMYCTICDCLVCLRCITDIHKLHEYKMMEDFAKETKTQLENVFEQIKTNQIPKLEMSAVVITEIQENYSQEKEKLMKSIITRGEDIKLAVDQIINKLRDEWIQQATADETCLKETKEKINLELTILKTQLNEEEQKVRKFSDVDMIVKATGIKDSLTQLTKRSSEINVQPAIQIPKYQIGQDIDNDLKKMVGHLMFKVNTGTEECILDQAGEKQNQRQADPSVSTEHSAVLEQNQDPVKTSTEAEITMGSKLGQSTEGGPSRNEITTPKINKNCVNSLDVKGKILKVEPNQRPMNFSTDKLKFQDANKVPVSPTTDKSKVQNTEKEPVNPPKEKSKVVDSRIIKANIVSSFQSKKHLCRIKLLNQKEAWFSTEQETFFFSKHYLELINDQGKQIKSLRPGFEIWDMDTTTRNNLLVTQRWEHHIRRISRLGGRDIFADVSPYWTYGIHVTKNGDILVGLYHWKDGSKISRLSSQGQTLQVIDKTTIDKDLGRPHRITENVNQDIVMICEWSYIIVVDRNGKFRFKYTGSKQIKMARVFRPVDIICNQNGHILVADSYNNTIHLLDKNGNFIQFILDQPQVLKEPTALAIDGTNRLWVGCDNGQVFVVDLF